MRIRAFRLLVAIMQAQSTFVNVRAHRVRPFSFARRNFRFAHVVQRGVAIVCAAIEIALHTDSFDRIVTIETPATAQLAQARRTIGMHFACLALLTRLNDGPVVLLISHRCHCHQWHRLIQPFAAQSKLIFTGVNGKAETLLRCLAPNASTLLFQTRRTIGGALMARCRTHFARFDRIRRTAIASTTCIIRPPFASRINTFHAIYKVRTIGTFIRMND